MSGYSSSADRRDPVKQPGQIPLDEWSSHDLHMVAECEGCGRTRVVNRAELIRRYGYGGAFPQRTLDALAAKLKCVHCERHRPRLSLVVAKDQSSLNRQ